jgi:hypothetical protein
MEDFLIEDFIFIWGRNSGKAQVLRNNYELDVSDGMLQSVHLRTPACAKMPEMEDEDRV